MSSLHDAYTFLLSQQTSKLNLLEFTLFLLLSVTWVLVMFYFYDRLLGIIFTRIVNKYFNLNVRFGSLSFHPFSPKVCLRNVRVSSPMIKIDQLEFGLNQRKHTSPILNEKLLYLKLINTELVFDGNDAYDELFSIEILKKSILDFRGFSIFIVRTAQIFNLGKKSTNSINHIMYLIVY